MKFKCRWCGKEIEIPQSERAKHGDKRFDNHEAECFKEKHGDMISFMNEGCSEVCFPDDVFTDKGENVTEIIRRLQAQLGRIPTESETMVEMVHARAIRGAMKL
jgi:hypothetical protein